MRLLGEGHYASVYELDEKRVLRVSRLPKEDAWVHYGKWCSEHTGFHLPRVTYCDDKEAIIEKLSPVNFDYKLPFSQFAGFISTTSEISEEFRNKFSFDFNYQNFMLRGSLLVITDPLIYPTTEDWDKNEYLWKNKEQ